MVDLVALKKEKEQALEKVLKFNRMLTNIDELLIDKSIKSIYSVKELIELYNEFYNNVRIANQQYHILDNAYELAKIGAADGIIINK